MASLSQIDWVFGWLTCPLSLLGLMALGKALVASTSASQGVAVSVVSP